MTFYNHKEIEPKWQKYWADNHTFKTGTDASKPKFYALDMFPYPSGAGLHVGHPEGYTATDILSRFKRAQGYNVLHPMGWDAFGLPAEQYAMDTGNDPADFTAENIANFKRQINALGFSYDWDREVNTTDPNYYKWTHMQRNWIGKSTGAHVSFKVKDTDKNFTVFTTRPDTLFGATYAVLAPEHDLVASITSAEQAEVVAEYKRQASLKSDLARTDLAKDKTGVWTGAYAINPVNGKEMPIWIADYVLASYGTGAIMAVPAHDERDWEFAKQFNLEILPVLEGGDVTQAAFTEDGPHINSDFLDGLNKEDAIAKMVTWLEDKGLGEEKISYRLRDWLFSRQRYWGEPIPIIHWEDGSSTAVPESDLPLVLPVTKDIRPSGTGESPLANLTDWLEVTREDGVKGRRETNTMPQWAGSSWYYLRYIDPHNTEKLADEDLLKQWLPVDIYVGGAEHAVLHLLYARFWHKFLYDIGVVPTKEPFQKLFNQEQIEAMKFNTAIAQLMIFINSANKEDKLYVEYAKGFIQLLAPFAPHLGEELWQKVTGRTESISYVAWPSWDESKLVESEVEIVVQIKGKVKAKLMVPKDASREELETIAMANEKIQTEIAGKDIVKVISVPNKLVNIVIK